MLTAEALDLTTRILEVFQGPPGHVWEEELVELDAGRAGTAFVRLKREHEHRWLSIAQFMAAYKAIHVDRPTGAPPCDQGEDGCGGSGWVTSSAFTHGTRMGEPVPYTAMEPCRCAEGRKRAQSPVWTKRGAA